MTREVEVLDRFEHGTLLETTPPSPYTHSGNTHVYYVPDGARETAAMTLEAAEPFLIRNYGPDREHLKTLVSARELVERAEETTLDPDDGAIGRDRRDLSPWSDASDDDLRVPPGVIKFSDPDAHSESSVHRDPRERGYCWNTVYERVLASEHCPSHIDYYNEIRGRSSLDVRIPVYVSRAGPETIAAYLVAHDYRELFIEAYLGVEQATIDAIVKTAAETT